MKGKRKSDIARLDPFIVLPKNMGLNWLGCGDLFRGEFIHQVLSKKPENIIDAAKAASIVVMERIKRMPLLENNDI